MRVLITGASGFIGSYFINKYKSSYSFETFSFLKDNFDALNLKDIDCILHLSALVHQMGGASEEAYEQINLNQTLKLAQKAKEYGVKHFVFMSTVKVYGEENKKAYSEISPTHPKDAYGKSKLQAEIALSQLEEKNFCVAIVRTPIVYGYGVKANIQNLIKLIKKVPILPFGDIHNRRSMIYVGNLCHLLDAILTQKAQGVFLASDDKALSTSELIEYIAKHLHKRLHLVKVPLFSSLLKQLKPLLYQRLYQSLEVDNHRSKAKLKIQNPYSTDEGIKLMIQGEKF